MMETDTVSICERCWNKPCVALESLVNVEVEHDITLAVTCCEDFDPGND